MILKLKKENYNRLLSQQGFLGALVIKNPPANAEDARDRFNPWARKIPWRRKWKPTAVFLPVKFQLQRGLKGYSPWGHEELDTTK